MNTLLSTHLLRKGFYALPVLCLLCLLPACDKPLEEEVYSFISTDKFYKTEADAYAAVMAAYEPFIADQYYRRMYYQVTELPADQVTLLRNPTFMSVENFNITADHPFISDLWLAIYRGINRANTVIDRVSKIDMDPGKKATFLAEGHYIRAFNYFNLVRLFGGVPLSTSEVDIISETNVPKATPEQIYELIISDLKIAENDLPASFSGADLGRATKWAAKTLLAHVYLTRENWTEAAAKSAEVMASGQYRMLENFEDVFKESRENNEETIFSIQFNGVNSNWIASFAHAGGTDNPQCFSGVQVFQVEEKSDMWKNWDPQDSRRNFTVYDKFVDKKGKLVSVYDTPRPTPAFGKYNAPSEQGTDKCPLNLIAYRYPDVLLMFAEAASQANGGPSTAAYEAFNQVRRRAYKQPLNQPSAYDLTPGMSGQDFRGAVIKERSLEFVMEGKRLYDLMRTGQFPGILSTLGKSYNAKARLLPIPQAEIDANDALSAQDQNEGY